MADNNIIKPVEGLQNIGALTPVKQRNKRRPKQNRQNNKEENHDEGILNELTGEQGLNDEIIEGKNQPAEDSKDDNPDSAGIDYCA